MKVNRFLFLLFALFSCSWLQAGVVTEQQALQKAEQFLKGKKIKSSALARGTKKSGANFDNAFYVFNVENKGGFVIVSGDDRTPDILGYATNGEMDLDNLPSNVKAWLSGYQKQIQALDRQKTSSTTRGSGNWTAVDENNTLIKTKWGQGSPYNLKCPVLKNEYQEDQNCITGCVATAIAQIMNYWKCPANGYLRSLEAYDVEEWDDNTNQRVISFTVPAIDAATIDWNKLKTSYQYDETDKSAQQVAELMRHVGQSEYMQYGLYSSGAYTAQGNWLMNFGYNKGSAKFIDRNNYSTEEWDEIIYNEVSSGRPVLYNGFSNYEGHAFICDGYAGEGRFWINWGWNGYCDGQYLLSVLNDDDSGIGPNAGEVDPGEGYNFDQGAFIGIQPANGNEGKVFTVPSTEGQEITFMITSDKDGNRACVVGDGSNPAIENYYEGALTIPSQVSYDNKTYTVTEIGDYAFGWIPFTTISLPSTIKKIGTWVFVDNWNVQELVIPKSVTEISKGMIINCGNLTSLTVENGNGKYTSPNNNVIIENGTKIIAGTRTTTISKDITAIGAQAFWGMYDMKLTIPQTVTTIGEQAFAWCRNCAFTVEYALPLEINKNTFEGVGENGCILKVPAGTKSAYQTALGWSAFGDNILEGDAGTEFKAQVGGNAFDMTFTITGSNTVKVGSLNANWNTPAVDRVLFNGDYDNNIQPTQTAIVVPETVEYKGKSYIVTEIGDNAFNYVNFKTITLPSTLLKIGSEAFANIFNMAMTIPQSVTTIEVYAFAWCYNCVFTVEYENPLEINKYSFEGVRENDCILKVPAGTKSAYKAAPGWSAFGNNILEGNEGTEFQETVDNGLLMWFTITDKNEVKVGHLIDGQAIDGAPFNSWGPNGEPERTSITIPKTVTHEGTTYKITAIGKNAFSDIGMESITLPNTIREINSYSFLNCYNLKAFKVPASVTSIREFAFAMCNSIKSVKVASGNEVYESPAGSNAIIEKESKTLMFGFKNTVIPDNVTKIGPNAFRYFTDLKVTIPKSVKEIGYNAFTDCWGESVVTVEYTDLSEVTLGNDVFIGSAQNGMILLVPKGMKSIYLATEGWNMFPEEHIRELEEEIVLDKTELVIAKGQTEVLTATCPPTWTDKRLTWESSDESVVIVKAGKIKGMKVGTATITCKSVATGVEATCEVTVGYVKLSKYEVAIQKGKTLTLKAAVYPTTEDQSVTWESSDPTIVKVTSAGKIGGLKVGTAIITCTSKATGLSATCEVTVGYVKLSKSEVTIQKGKTLTLKAAVYPTTEDQSVTWESSNTKIATVSEDGKVKGVRTGTATITCTSNATGLSATCTVTVGYVKLSKSEVTIQKGKTLTLKAAVYPTTEDQSVTWESSDPTIVKVTSAGKIGGLKVGTAIITCTSKATGLSATCEVTVGYVKLSKYEVAIQKGKTLTLKAAVYPTTEDQSVTWKSSDPTIVKVTSTGKIGGMKVGTATITCTSNATGLSATCVVTVTAASARSLDGEVTDIDDMEVDPATVKPFDVYDLSGRKVLHQVTSLDGLSDGIYIVNGKKILKKQ